ncbi:MAG: nucleotide sugar dehydrogenase [Leptospiraceae bacterium]|nr:nucleotide sugar dehydrogenase [Leptospiraceae bacterium]
MINLEETLKSIESKNYTVGVIGLGYVGLPLLWNFHMKGFQVIGFDSDIKKIQSFAEKKSYIKHIDNQVIEKLSESNRCMITSDFSKISNTNAILICVPTPLTKYREPDMSYIQLTLDTIIPYLVENQIIILESTTYPGTTEEIVKSRIQNSTKLISEENILIAYSPEREDPGNSVFNTSTIPKVVGGDGALALFVATKLYSEVVVKVIQVTNTKTAEAVKLLENIFRSVNIALVNEMKIVFHKIGIDIHEVIEAAKTKPFGFMPFYPGPGLGGHCIPIDPFYLTWKAREFEVNTKFIELAGEINTNMPQYVVNRTIEALNSVGKSLSTSRILCLGLAYKSDIDDMRESPAFKIMDILVLLQSIVEYYDPFISEISATREHSNWNGKQSIQWSKELIESFDCIIIITKHTNIDYNSLLLWAKLIVDTRNSFINDDRFDQKIWKA